MIIAITFTAPIIVTIGMGLAAVRGRISREKTE
jgi:hypothetical protein